MRIGSNLQISSVLVSSSIEKEGEATFRPEQANIFDEAAVDESICSQSQIPKQQLIKQRLTQQPSALRNHLKNNETVIPKINLDICTPKELSKAGSSVYQ